MSNANLDFQRAQSPANALPAWPSVVLCIPTYRRPAGLRNLLENVAKVVYGGDLSVIVVDNDPQRCEGRLIVEDMSPKFPRPIQCEVEPNRGHTFAYNCAFGLACGSIPKPEYVAVLDDDEFPDSRWLEHMIRTAGRFRADIVGGPVLPVYEEKDHWLTKTGLYMPPALRSGIVPMIFGAGNMLVRTSVLAQYPIEPFPNEYAFTGGSDLDFFRRCRSDGRRFAWASEAHVFETIPASRLALSWLLRRAFRVGNDLTRVDRKYSPGPRPAIVRWLKGVGLLLYGISSLPLSSLRGRCSIAKSLYAAARGTGRLAAEFNWLYPEYAEKNRPMSDSRSKTNRMSAVG
jgi:glycosyltransferase involved in cell wall biosynthesis